MDSAYSIILSELGAALDRETLEEISVAVPGVGKADCVNIAREIPFGIAAGGLGIKDAVAFRAALEAKNIRAQIAPDTDLPRLPNGQFFTRITTGDETFTLTDCMGRTATCYADDILFAAGGFLNHKKNSVYREVKVHYHSSSGIYVEPIKRDVLKEFSEFRLEFFIRQKPYRLRLSLDAGTSIVWNKVALRVEKPDPPRALLQTVRARVPRNRQNLGLRNTGEDFCYPSLRAFENEIRRRFYLLKKK